MSETRPTDNPRLILGLKLRSLRRDRALTLSELARASGLSISYLSEIEKGKKYPKPEKLQRLAGALEIPFDQLVSLKVGGQLDPLREAMGSGFLREFPFELFGFETEDLVSLLSTDPARAGALVRVFLEVGRFYDVEVEHFLLAALRAYQQMNANHFEELEREAAEFRREQGWPAEQTIGPEPLEKVLAERYGYSIDQHTLPEHPGLKDLRSVFKAGRAPRLYVNGRLLPSQRAFVLGRELGYRRLGLEARAVSSSWLRVESFEQVLNNFKASYFSGALLLDLEALGADLEGLFAAERWQPEGLLALMRRYDATPETLFHRLTQILPRRFGLGEIYFMRFSDAAGENRYHLTKVLNMSRVPVPHGIGLDEHYCRRWPAMKLLSAGVPRSSGAEEAVIVAQRSHFLDEDAEFLVISAVRPLALASRAASAVSLGFRLDGATRRRLRFWNDPAIPRVEVNLTCERCPLEDCRERTAPQVLHAREQKRVEKEKALAELLARN